MADMPQIDMTSVPTADPVTTISEEPVGLFKDPTEIAEATPQAENELSVDLTSIPEIAPTPESQEVPAESIISVMDNIPDTTPSAPEATSLADMQI